ncbi:chaplin family protein [Actinoplanes sp. NPDC004185]
MKLVRGFALIVGVATAALAFSAPASAHGWDDDYNNHHHHKGHHGSQYSSGNVGLLNGNQAYIPVHIPLNVCGNSIAILGLANSNAGCVNN